jgi:hypothetical protein
MNKKRIVKRAPTPTLQDLSTSLKCLLAEDSVNELGRDTKLSTRLRDITPHRLLLSILNALAGGKADAIADLHRELNHCFGLKTAYKAFYNRLSHQGFADFMKEVCMQMVKAFSMEVLEAKTFKAVEQFDDIVAQDGTSFGLKTGVDETLGGGTSKAGPTLRIHTLMSVLKGIPVKLTLTGNKTSEPSTRPKAMDLAKCLYLGDRAYASKSTFLEFVASKASFIIRMPRNYNPMVVGTYDKGVYKPYPPTKLNAFLAGAQNHDWDLAVRFKEKRYTFMGRVVVRRSQEDGNTRLCTNLSPEEFHGQDVGQLYRLRWQIELLFKEWKSYTNLTSFKSTNKHINEGLAWAAMACATLVRFMAHSASALGTSMVSTMKTAKSAKTWFRKMTDALTQKRGRIKSVLKEIIEFLQHSALVSNTKRMKEKGKLNMGLRPVRNP